MDNKDSVKPDLALLRLRIGWKYWGWLALGAMSALGMGILISTVCKVFANIMLHLITDDHPYKMF